MSKAQRPAKPRSTLTKVVAAEFLRTLAIKAHLPVGDPVARAADLRLLADCIEGKVRWKKGAKRSFSQRRQIGQAAQAIELRASGVSVKAALSDQVTRLAALFGENTEQQQLALRGEIETLRKLQRKHFLGESEK